MWGRAMFTAVMSRITISCATRRTGSSHACGARVPVSVFAARLCFGV